MVVHPGAGHGSGTLVNALLAHCSDLAGVEAICGRASCILDGDTSGLGIVAKRDQPRFMAYRASSGDEPVAKILALVVGSLAQTEGIIGAPIA